MTFNVEIISPEFAKTFEAKMVILPGQLGLLGVMKDHANIIVRLANGSIVIDEKEKIPLSSGLAHMQNGTLKIISNSIKL